MRKYVIILLLLLLLTVGCSSNKSVKAVDVDAPYNLISLSDIPVTESTKEFITRVEISKKEMGAFYHVVDSHLILFVGLGEQRSDECSLKVKSIQTHNDGETYLAVVEKIIPEKATPTDKAFYPYVLVDLGNKRGGTKEIRVLDQLGIEYPHIFYYLNPPRTKP